MERNLRKALDSVPLDRLVTFPLLKAILTHTLVLIIDGGLQSFPNQASLPL